VTQKSFSPGSVMRALLFAASAVAFAGCAPSIVLEPPAPVAADTTAGTEPPIIELRYFSFSPTVSVVGWSGDNDWYGLRTTVRRDGSLVRDHRLYVNTYYKPWMRSFYFAAVPPRGLEMLGVSRDPYACYFGRCSPFEMLAVRIPDELLRANRDSVTVTFYGGSNRKMMITVHRDLIEPYLASVDSVSSALRRLQ
jgi:hypothetical protein